MLSLVVWPPKLTLFLPSLSKLYVPTGSAPSMWTKAIPSRRRKSIIVLLLVGIVMVTVLSC